MGFRALGRQVSHQARWKKPVSAVYADASLPWEWTVELKAACDNAGIDFFSTPYDFEAADMLDPYVQVFKLGSGDITWLEMLTHVAGKGKPVILSSGASDILDVQRAVRTVEKINPQLALLQCNTNYTGDDDNFNHIHLNVLTTYHTMFPGVLTGLSDHTPGCATVLGAVALGGRIIEKHFTDDARREGPDHGFSMTPHTWREMVDRTRELERALGSPQKFVAGNERDTVVVQRRCVRAARDLPPGTVLTRDMLDVLRPAPEGAVNPFEIDRLLGRTLAAPLGAGQHLTWSHVAPLPAAPPRADNRAVAPAARAPSQTHAAAH
ncbi:N,N'-diacetyllegionaminic acid synthase [Phycisphaerae bacterium RAS1]|nr:N,N'-diacetyllegionaminic acid synthase [Phycisphaerae bacterium RAS1]